jgi:hypothetical protein
MRAITPQVKGINSLTPGMRKIFLAALNFPGSGTFLSRKEV